MHDFDREFWEQHWHERSEQHGAPHKQASPANPYLAQETASLTHGTALDAGCGTGAEAIWLASQGWQVTGADISPTALATAKHATSAAAVTDQNLSGRLTWVEADLTVWQPEKTFDLVVTNYAHPTIPQLEFYSRLADWVSPGGTLLIIGHLHGHGDHEDGHRSEHGEDSSGIQPPVESTVTPAQIAALLPTSDWRIDTAEEHHRAFAGDHPLRLHDAVVRATRIN